MVSNIQRHFSSPPGTPRLDPRRPVPNFFIVGAAKAGTTSLHAYLSAHPDVCMSTVKEPHFFSSFEAKPEFDNFEPPIRDPGAYQALFDHAEGRTAIGEASPSYLCDVNAAQRIKAAVPNAKIVISLRNPVERAYSAYLMEFHAGREKLPFEQALEADRRRTEKGWGVSFGYDDLGLYAKQVERYMKVFGHDNVHVLFFEDLIRDTPAVTHQIARFVNVDPSRFPASTFETVHNPFEVSRGEIARTLLRWKSLRMFSKRWIPQALRDVASSMLFTGGRKPNLGDDLRTSLGKRFAADLDELEEILGRDVGVLRGNR